MAHRVFRAAATNTFAPKTDRRAAASAALRPSSSFVP